jgi:membrane-associated phospholipid phosphatase
VKTVLAERDLRLVESRISGPSVVKIVRPPEWILFAFLIYAPSLTFFRQVPHGLGNHLASLNLLIILAYAGLIFLDLAKPRLNLEIIRDWLPLGMIILAYREMGWFALPHHLTALEVEWFAWDRLVLDHGGRAVVESLGFVIPSALEISYALVYVLPPVSLAILYVYGRRKVVERFLTVVLLSTILCYGQFPFWPTEPPRVVFAGLDLAPYNTVFRRFNLWMLGNYGIHTGVFPSAHVAGALSTAFGMRLAMPESKRVYRSLFLIAALIAIATVYGRYHYLADATSGAGIAFAVTCFVRGCLSDQIASAVATSPIKEPKRAANDIVYRYCDFADTIEGQK